MGGTTDMSENFIRKLTFAVTNGNTLTITQRSHDGASLVSVIDAKGFPTADFWEENAVISPGDFVMLVNYWHYVKRYDIQNDFINPNGKHKEEN